MMKKTKTKTKNQSTSSSPTSDNSAFHVSVTKIAVAQICQSVGYRRTQPKPLDVLTDVTIRFLQSLAYSAVTVTNSAGRTESNLHDVIIALEDVYRDVGFAGNSDVRKPVTSSLIVRDVMKFVYRSREIPFAKPLPRRRRMTSSPPWFCYSGETARIPVWLPEFPKIVSESNEPIESISNVSNNISNNEVEISELPKKRKKVRFTISCVRNRVRNGSDKMI